MIVRSAKRLGVLMFAAALFAAAPEATAQALPPPAAWNLTVKADAAAKAAGRYDFQEEIQYDATTCTSGQISKLGMSTTAFSSILNVTGEYVVDWTMNSNMHGTIVLNAVIGTNTLTGTMAWTRDGKVYNYTFSGTKFTPPAESES